MIREIQLFPLDRCCRDWTESLRRDAIQLTFDGYCLTSSAQYIARCPFCGGDKRGSFLSLMPLTT